MLTVCESGLLAFALHIIQPYWTSASAKVGTWGSRDRMTTAELSAHHVGIGEFPFIIAHGAPLAFIEDLHPTGALTWAAHQPNRCCRKKKSKRVIELNIRALVHIHSNTHTKMKNGNGEPASQNVRLIIHKDSFYHSSSCYIIFFQLASCWFSCIF